MIRTSRLIGIAVLFLTILTGFRLLWLQWSANLASTQEATRWIVLFACAVYFANALYAFIVYMLGLRSKRDHRLLYFSWIVVLVIFATLLSEGFLSAWLPPGGKLYDKAVMLGLIAGGFLLWRLIRPSTPLILSMRWRHADLVLAAGLAIVIVLLPNPAQAGLLYVAALLAFVPCVLALVLLYKTTTAHDKGGIWLFFGTLAAVNSFAWLIAIELMEIPFVSYPFDLLIAILCYSVFFFQKYFHALVTAERMSVLLNDLLELERIKDSLAPADNGQSHQERIRILAVDDNPEHVGLLDKIFSTRSCEFVSATSGAEALALLDADRWDLVIANAAMPGMSGYELAAHIRKTRSIIELPILLLTESMGLKCVEAGFEAGANDFVAKPINAVELVTRAESLIHLKQSVQERMRMEAALLQAQIKPHFMINTFNSIAALGRIDLDRMDDMIEELSTYIRLSIDFQNTDGLAPIERELDLVRSYLYIQEKRFGDRLKVIWEVDPEAQVHIPPLTIQPLVENAISHGILKRISGGVIRIVIRKETGAVTVAIHDNGVGMSRDTVAGLLEPNERHERRHAGIGLRNTDRRLKQVFGEGLAIESAAGEGTTVSFRVTDVPGEASREPGIG